MIRRTLLAVACVAALTAPAVAQDMDVADVAAAQPDASTFVAAAEEIGLTEALHGPGPFTLFIPSDTAFASLPPGTWDEMMAPVNRGRLAATMGYHVVHGSAVMAAQIAAAGDPGIRAVAGEDLAVLRNGALIDGAKILRGDIAASNGVIHIIDTVLLPPPQ